LQYESLRIPEYWIWDVKNFQIIAFAIAPDGSSKQIEASRVLPDLPLDLLSEALRRSEASDDSAVIAWFMEQLAA
jgi:Uma2 family endonuclease